MLTISKVNKQIKSLGYELELVKGDGYFYFAPTGKDNNFGPSVYVHRVNQLRLDQWIQELVDFKK